MPQTLVVGFARLLYLTNKIAKIAFDALFLFATGNVKAHRFSVALYSAVILADG